MDLIKEKALKLIKNSKTAILATIDVDGCISMRAMLNLEYDNLKTIWFSTNTSSKKIKQVENNDNAGVYFYDADNFKGLRLMGKIKMRADKEIKQKLWRDGFEMYYPKGIDDSDYCVLEFKTIRGSYYQGFKNTDFKINKK